MLSQLKQLLTINVTYLDLEKLRVGFILGRKSLLAGRDELGLVLDASLKSFKDVRLNVVAVEL